ncbi:cis-2,3-dihydrobiphenyl-2,3-diol dehydrogenase [Mycobacterium paraense]|uniref:Cis-2,3-dihydrobiphenyl-2,3-diol dehydrogenase n=1 Tax=Mycobacterium paraense TaxID=767916 RepID=A0ABX3VSB4_9MYCO|nr:SDR family NAD(P)-dependent oxidoreductase [Mycobacterium paraense]ORW32733.1 cis-2,3-dihydrobiphenyl-2,3-diol dehydrogenase [Mycobacterium paraense]ORW44958.1 cis-2,3-dihydrobiphenyl-2,3-diol dehydrogenase [Mycobacterium paraense]
MTKLPENVSLITGAGSGLGRALVDRFLCEGSHVGVLERSLEKAQQIEADYGDAIVVTVGDTASPADNAAAVERTIEKFGRLDTFIGNAGQWDFGTALRQLPLDAWSAAFDQLFAVNVKGYLLGARASVDALRETAGSMIFTLSNCAFLAGGGGPIYVASKHAVRGLITQLAWELHNQVRVNGVAPGLMSTEMSGSVALGQDRLSLRDLIDSAGGEDEFARRLGIPFVPAATDYVSAYVLLASNESRTTTGAIFELHGMLGPPPSPPT